MRLPGGAPPMPGRPQPLEGERAAVLRPGGDDHLDPRAGDQIDDLAGPLLRLLDGDAHGLGEVFARQGERGAGGAEHPAAPVAGDIAEQVDRPFADPVVEVEHPVVGAPGRALGPEPVGIAAPPAAGVELRPALGVAQQVIGLGRLAEPVGRDRVVRVGVGVQLLGERAVGPLDFVERGRGLDAEDYGRGPS